MKSRIFSPKYLNCRFDCGSSHVIPNKIITTKNHSSSRFVQFMNAFEKCAFSSLLQIVYEEIGFIIAVYSVLSVEIESHADQKKEGKMKFPLKIWFDLSMIPFCS